MTLLCLPLRVHADQIDGDDAHACQSRTRAKAHLPHVLLTLLSIIQALALELYWAELQSLDSLFQISWPGIMVWLQASATFLGILVIWIVYATTVMRFSWVPSISDSVIPFFVGLIQFVLIESLGAADAGAWFFSLAIILAIMHGESHMIMRRARQDQDNAEFFEQINPATIADFVPPALMVLCLLGFSAYVTVMPASPFVIGIGFAASLLLMIWHLVFMGMFWRRTMGEPDVVSPGTRSDHSDSNSTDPH